MDHLKAQEARASKTTEPTEITPRPPTATPTDPETVKKVEPASEEKAPATSQPDTTKEKEKPPPITTSIEITKPTTSLNDNKIPGPDFLQSQMTAARAGGNALSILSPVQPKPEPSTSTDSGPTNIIPSELLTAKAPMPLSNVQEEKKSVPELPPYANQPPPMPTTTGRGRGGRGRGGRGSRSTQNNTDMQHQAYMAGMSPYSGYGGFPGQQMPGMGPCMQGFNPNAMMQPGAGMMPNINPSQFPPGSQFPNM